MPNNHRRPSEQGDGLHGPDRDGQPIIFRGEQTIKLDAGEAMIVKTYTEKRFFEWHEDEQSVTLRNSGASYGGAARSW